MIVSINIKYPNRLDLHHIRHEMLLTKLSNSNIFWVFPFCVSFHSCFFRSFISFVFALSLFVIRNWEVHNKWSQISSTTDFICISSFSVLPLHAWHEWRKLCAIHLKQSSMRTIWYFLCFNRMETRKSNEEKIVSSNLLYVMSM